MSLERAPEEAVSRPAAAGGLRPERGSESEVGGVLGVGSGIRDVL